MAGSLRLIMRSSTAWEDQTVTAMVAPDWTRQILCTYDAALDAWTVDLPTGQLQPGEDMVLKFRCEGEWNDPQGQAGNIIIPADRVGNAEYEIPGRVKFPASRRPSRVASPARELFRGDWNPQQQWDFIVIGSGMGGGVLAHELARNAGGRGAKVLVLEAGGYLFPTHVGNLPRKHSLDRQHMDKSIWDLYWRFRRQEYTKAGSDHAAIDVATADTFGGRSIFWGSTAPRLSAEELKRWPADVRTGVTRFYPLAEALLHVGDAPGSEYQTTVLKVLRELLPSFAEHLPAPMAVEYRRDDVPSAIPNGIFSTAALLLEDLLQEAELQDRPLVHLHEPVVGFDGSQTRIEAVHTRHALTGEPRSYRVAAAGRVILAAGSVASPALVLRSGIAAPRNLGQGLTDHPIFVAKFKIPPGNEFSPVIGDLLPAEGQPRSSKTLSRRSGGALPGGLGYNLLMELGAVFNQSRFGSAVELRRVKNTEVEDLGSWCEAVFLLDADLVATNSVALVGDDPVLTMDRVVTPAGLRDELVAQADAIATAFGGTPVDEPGNPTPDHLFEARLGGVGHECGTLRMGDGPESVVDTDLKLRDHDNLYVCDLSVFPTSPASNPSLTLAALALRLADHLIDQ